MQPLTTRHIHNVRVRWRDGDGADRLRGFVIEDRIPRASIVVRLPDAAVHLSDIKDVWLAWNSRRSARPATAKRPNHSPAQFLVSVLRNLARRTSYEKRSCDENQQA